MSTRFSQRHGYRGTEPEITIREDAPENLRFAVAQIAVDAGMHPSDIRQVVCRVLFVAPDRDNWSEYPNIWGEVQNLLIQCDWFKVYDIAEALYQTLHPHTDRAEAFQAELNRCFRENGIGWELTENGIMYRGDQAFAVTTSKAVEVLTESRRSRAASEIREALKDISRRPTPDITGAIQHAAAALECTARDVLNEPKLTLGDLVKRLNLPKPLDTATEKLWGFASDKARHMEGEQIDDAQVELVVSVACAVCIFLSKRLPQQ
jgi:hypothetical protein